GGEASGLVLPASAEFLPESRVPQDIAAANAKIIRKILPIETRNYPFPTVLMSIADRPHNNFAESSFQNFPIKPA
ncbi:MAG TPA: hypothetical protein DEA22_11240, partial [Blastocatellia bacterium]|nr:hypothetical protein [Blastocatellia bacterium]